jgi:hexosaminidase
MENDIWPRIIATAELTWTPAGKKNYDDFVRRIDNQRMRLDVRGVNYYIPQPEDANAPSLNRVAFTDSHTLEFRTTEPVAKMVYTVDGTEPTASSREYASGLTIDRTTTLKIRSVLPSGTMSPVRTIELEKQSFAPAVTVPEDAPKGIRAEYFKGYRRKVAELGGLTPDETEYVETPQRSKHQVPGARELYPDDFWSTVLTGYMEIPEDGVYCFSTDHELWIDGKPVISNEADNDGTATRFSRSDRSVALAAGAHSFRLVRMGAIFGGWPAQWANISVSVRPEGRSTFTVMSQNWFR